MRLTPRVAGFRSEYPAGFKLECMAGFVGTRFPQFGKTGWWRPSGPNCLLPTQSSKPVSETRVRNGIFCCRDQAAKRAHSARLQEQRPRQPENLADMSLRDRKSVV